jgi:hypothetical protein
MNVIQIINEEIKQWYHGTPDVRDIRSAGSFSPRTDTTTFINDPQKYDEIQAEMTKARASGNEKLYMDLHKQLSPLVQDMTYKKPIYFTGNRDVARTYADPWRAFDYQNSEPSVLTAKINDRGKVLTISALGESFRGIDAGIVKNAFMKDGVDESTIDNYFNIFRFWVRNGRMESETLGIIAQLLGYDIVDVVGVKDSYRAGKINSTVRMVFDPSRIEISK